MIVFLRALMRRIWERAKGGPFPDPPLLFGGGGDGRGASSSGGARASRSLPENIIVDDRERSLGLLAELRASFPNLRVERLRVGDVSLDGRVLIERKTAPDFAASIMNGRLDGQLAALAALGEFDVQAVVIVEGEFEDIGAGGVSPEALREAMLAIELDHGIPLLRSRSPLETALWVRALAPRAAALAAAAASRAGAQTAARAKGAPPAAGRGPGGRANSGAAPDGPPGSLRPRADGSRSPAASAPWRRARARREDAGAALGRDMLAAIPGVGRDRAAALLARFGDLRGVFEAPVADLMKTPGVGPKLAQRIHAVLRGQSTGTRE